MTVKPIPEGYHTVTPYLVVNDVERLIRFLKEGLGATETHPIIRRPDGKVMHAEVRLGDSMIMMGEPMKPSDLKPTNLYVYVVDTDAVYNSAMKAGAESIMAPADQFWGDRSAGSGIRRVTSGGSQRTSKMCRSRSCPAGWKRWRPRPRRSSAKA